MGFLSKLLRKPIEFILFSNSSEFFCLPHSFSSGSRVPRIPLRSLRIPLLVLLLHCGVRLRIPPVRRVIPEFHDFQNVRSGARARVRPRVRTKRPVTESNV